MTAPVRLRPAYSWECRCGAKNWEEAIVPKARLVRLGNGRRVRIHPEPSPPRAVRCRSCGVAFAAEGG